MQHDRRTCLENANLKYAQLQDVSLEGANLRGANLYKGFPEGARFVPATGAANPPILPDGTSWTPNTDMRRFTDPAHPIFWRSDDPNSPAYRDGWSEVKG